MANSSRSSTSLLVIFQLVTFSCLHTHSGVVSAAFFAMPGRVPGFRYPLSALLAGGGQSMAEKVLTNPKWPAAWPYSKEDFTRMDESDDFIFYDQPRLVYHIDDVRTKENT